MCVFDQFDVSVCVALSHSSPYYLAFRTCFASRRARITRREQISRLFFSCNPHSPTYALSLVELRAILTEPIPLTIVVFCFGFVPFVFFLATVQGCVRVVALFFSSSSSLWLFGARRHRCCLPREETPKPCGLSQWNVIATGPPAVYQSLFY